MEGSISSDLVQILLRSVSGETITEMLERVGIDPSMLASTGGRIPAEQVNQLWRALFQAAEDPHLGLHLGEVRDGFPMGHVLFATMMNSATIGHAVQRFCRFHDLMADVAKPELTQRGDAHVLELIAQTTAHPQYVECVVSLVVSLLKTLTPKGELALEIRFVHEPPSDPTEHNRILGPAIRWGEKENAILLPHSLWEVELELADAELVLVLERYAEKLLSRMREADTWSQQVARILQRDLCDGKPSLQEIATQLKTSTRTLQNKLSAEGMTYQGVLELVRKNMALDYLEHSDLTAGEIAFLLGYAEQSTFNHAFKRWTGEAPQRYRTIQAS